MCVPETVRLLMSPTLPGPNKALRMREHLLVGAWLPPTSRSSFLQAMHQPVNDDFNIVRGVMRGLVTGGEVHVIFNSYS